MCAVRCAIVDVYDMYVHLLIDVQNVAKCVTRSFTCATLYGLCSMVYGLWSMLLCQVCLLLSFT